MAADQRRKGLNKAVDSVRDKSWGRKKEKRVGSVDSKGFGVKPHVALQWDTSCSMVIAKREQIGLTWRHLRRFAEPPSHRPKILADAFDVPRELFELEDLESVLSYEVWQTCLSEKERRFLAQFLPREIEPQQAVKQLFAGENFHFGNPFLDWASSLKSGNLHPDVVVHHEKCLKTENSAYYLELHRYHNDMIGSLLETNERCPSFRDLENEFNQKMLRPRKDREKNFMCADRSEACNFDNGFAGTSKSSSLSTEEKTSNSDEQIELFKKGGELQKRISKKRAFEGFGNLSIVSDNVISPEAKPRKDLKLKKRNVVYNDGTKYMSYVKITKREHELIKRLEQSGSSIQPRSLEYLLPSQIQPYEVFVEEERKKLHNHWLHLVNHDLPSAYGIWNDFRSQRQQMMRSLQQDLLERYDSLMEDDDEAAPVSQHSAHKFNVGVDKRLTIDEDRESSPCSSEDQKDNRVADYASSVEDDEETTIPGFVNCQRGTDVVNHQFINQDLDESLPCSLQGAKLPGDLILDCPGIIMHNKNANSVSGSPKDLLLNQGPSTSSSNPNFNIVCPQSKILKPGSITQDVAAAYSGNLDRGDLIDIDRIPYPQGSEIWQPACSASNMQLTYFDSTSEGCQFNSTAEILLPTPLRLIDGHQQAPHWSDIGSDSHGQVQQLQRNSNSFISYSNDQDQSELLQSIFSGGQGMLHPGNSNSQQKDLCHLNYQIPESILAERYARRIHSSTQQSMSVRSMLPSNDGNMFLMQQRQQEQLLPTSVGIQDWAHHVPSTMQPQSLSCSDRFSNSNEHQINGGRWTSCPSRPSQTNSSVVNQSVYGILPHCSHLSPQIPSYDSIEQSTPSQTYGHGLMNGPGIGNVFPHQTAPILDYVNGQNDDTRWRGLPMHHNSSMNDSIGKPPFLGSWNP
ncbi:hypothetical protein SAY86_020192 [Trapa natans]|uniref:DEUBAD domain-containing protein n=1 Tax=Trapa natans TaxID=22666 RepID=A0AAN7LZ19_TRANT|nr:hypothetical protein SAY86_020192 [Trapa natans]